MKQYLQLVSDVLQNGKTHENRTEVPTVRVFGRQFRHDLRTGFPLLTTKKVFFRGVIEELLWMLRGETNVIPLQEKGIHIWDEWAKSDGDLGPVYGHQWRAWGPRAVDQIAGLLHNIRENPNSRRHIVTAWNPDDIGDCALPPCHCFFQVNVDGEYLDLHMYQRSADIFLGVPFNIASYGALLKAIAASTGKYARDLIISYGDIHAYQNHIPQLEQQIVRQPYPLPKLLIGVPWPQFDPWTLKFEDFKLMDYRHHPELKGEVAV